MSYYDNYGADIFADETLALTKRGKPRKRKPKEPRIYFTQDTEDAIVEYLACTDQVERNRIYNERIEYGFYKLAENIIHTFKFYYTDTDTIEELENGVEVSTTEPVQLEQPMEMEESHESGRPRAVRARTKTATKDSSGRVNQGADGTSDGIGGSTGAETSINNLDK